MSPPCKIRRTEDNGKDNDNGSPVNIVRYEFDGVSELDYDGKFSPIVEVKGVPMRINITKEKIHIEDVLCVYFVCEPYKSTRWSADLCHTQSILNYKDANKNVISRLMTDTYQYKDNVNSDGEHIMKWSVLMNEEKGFIKDDKIVVEIRMNIMKVTGIMHDSTFEFDQPTEPHQNVALVIGNEKIHACKEFLAIHSPVFKSMFFGAYDEKDKKEIPLNDVNPNEFKEMLAVLYPSGQKITDNSVFFILKLADRFQIKALIDPAENYLISSETLKLAFKLLLSDKFRLIKLQSHLMTQLKTPKEVTKLKDSPEYGELTETARSTLLERMIELVKEQDKEESSDDESIV